MWERSASAAREVLRRHRTRNRCVARHRRASVHVRHGAGHAARVRVRVGSDTSRVVTEWTNELTLGDSAGRPIMRWVTRGTQFPPNGPTVTWEILQTYDAVTLAPYGHVSKNSLGGFSRLAIDGRRARGTRKLPKDSVEQQVDLTIDRPGFIASASDLVPLAVGLKEGSVMTAPVWGPNMAGSELRIFSVIARVPLTVEGKPVTAWKVEERRHADRMARSCSPTGACS